MDCAKTNYTIYRDSLVSDTSVAVGMLVAAGVALAPVGMWFVQRSFDASDEPWGLVALFTLAVFWLFGKHNLQGWNKALLANSFLPAVFMGAFAVSQIGGPMLVRAILGASVVACFIGAVSRERFRFSHAALLLMSLPLLPSMQFFLGYPLRVAVAHMVATLVGVAGVGVDGTGLTYHGALVAIDAPCSGMRMLWTATYLALVLSCIKGFSTRQTVLLTVFAGAAAFGGNVMRAGSLVYGFYLASLAPAAPYVIRHSGYNELPYLHDSVGAISFAIVVALIAAAAHFMRKPDAAAPVLPQSEPNARRLQMTFTVPFKLPKRAVSLYFLAALAAVAINSINILTHDPVARSGQEFGGWPHSFEGQTLTPVSLSEWELNFAQNFPGRIAKFNAGSSQVLMRWIKRESRQVHSVQDCLRGAGFTVTPQALAVRPNGDRWATFFAVKNDTKLSVRERITDSQGGAWTDVSEWYWAALTGKSRGPWLAQTVVREQTEE